MASRVVADRDFGLDLCKALNLDSSKTRTITIISEPNNVVKINIEQYLLDTEAPKIIDIIMKFKYLPEDDQNKSR